ncbi:C2H2 type zinc-finger-domain-containing protein [Stachybotrys elegans]|uniref:C2H2 type zinc-finger-domain-containing protein n=1 Tax=Stachybotrys elegans TaxID=80388 RepID=A0A8K0SIK5_9HYPO|nr:C2H2 type zinc-finger-domain-containing protein [Stachybotrys elegans]
MDSTTSPAQADAPALSQSAMLECRLCDLSFDTAEEKRQHAKSEWHVYKIRCRVAEPGTIVPPPGSSKPEQDRNVTRKILPPANDDQDEDSDSSTSSVEEVAEFVNNKCLFCTRTSQDFDENFTHMCQAHSLFIPFQTSLTVDMETLIWYLHLLIFSYRECICCGRRRRTVEAVQQHMASTGHCRFDISEEMSEFYDMESLSQQENSQFSHPDDHTLRLPSGKLLSHRSAIEQTPRAALKGKQTAASLAAPESHEDSATSDALTKKDRHDQALIAQFNRLSTSDQRSLMHLPASQQRSLLLTHKKELDKAKRAERRKRSKMDHVGNKIAVHTNYYKQEVPVYMGG